MPREGRAVGAREHDGIPVTAPLGERSVVLITGGTRGIGLAVAEAYASQGAVVVISGRSDRAALDDALHRLRAQQPDASGELVDVRQRRGVEDWVASVVERWGRIDVAIANAGVIRPVPFLELSEDQWDEVVGTHLKGTFLVLQAVARRMIEQHVAGSLITVTAPAAVRASTGVVDYASAKGGIIAMTRNLAKELAPWGIRVNSILPVAETRMTDALQRYRGASREGWAGQHPGGTMPRPEDVTGPFLFLGSPESRLVTGQVLAVDAGRSL